jgi:ubiquinone/menaquinone biosynthesis C-methylase UbiE
MSVLDVGCGMGFFSLPLAKLVGGTGKVVCVDLQGKND